MKSILLRTCLFAAIIACAYALLSTHSRLEDLVLCMAIQTCVPLFVWFAVLIRPIGRGMQVVVALFWTWLASSSLVLLADRFHDSSVYQPPRPWDRLFQEGGIIIYLGLMVPIFSVIAAGLTLIPFAREAPE